MVKKPFKGNYLTFEVRVSYDENTDTVHLTSKDKDIPTANGFHLAMNSGKDAEYALRTLLEERGMIPEERFKSIPSPLLYAGSPNSVWDRFPLGLHANGKEAVWNSSSSPNALIIGGTGSGKSVIQRNILAHCSEHNDKWKVLVLCPFRVEFSSYKNRYPEMIDLASTVSDGVEMIRYAHGEMMLRYAEMERLGVNHFLDMDQPLKSLLVLIDEVNWFLRPVGSIAQCDLEENELKAEAVQLLTEITRLGRAAGLHLALSSQALDEDVIGGEFLNNITTRIAAGPLDKSQSTALLGNTQATRLNRAIRGRGYLQEYSKGADFQGYFSTMDYLDGK